MKRWGIFFLVFVGAMYLSNGSVFAQRGGGVGGGGGRSFGVPGPSGGRESGFGTSRKPSGGQGIHGKSGIPGEEPGHGRLIFANSGFRENQGNTLGDRIQLMRQSHLRYSASFKKPKADLPTLP